MRQKLPLQLPPVASSRSAPNSQSHAHVSRSYNGPAVPPPRNVASVTRPNTAVSASSSVDSPVPTARRPLNSRPTNRPVASMARRASGFPGGPSSSLSRAVQTRRLSPPPARSNQSINPALASASVLLARSAVAKSSPNMTGSSRKPDPRQSASRFPRNRVQESTQSPSVDSSRRSSPDSSDDDDDEDGLFVSPPDPTKNPVKGPATKTLGVRSFANMPLPQDSDEEDLRPSHVLRQERRAAAGKPAKPIGRGGRYGKRARRASNSSDDSDDDFNDNFDDFSVS